MGFGEFKRDTFALLSAVVLGSGALSGCGQDDRDPQLNYGDPVPAKLSFSNLPWYDFGDRAVLSVSEKNIQIANTGGSTATDFRGSFYLSVHFAFKGGTFPGEGGTCSDSLVAGASCSVVITFIPQYSGQFEQPVSVLFHDGAVNQKVTGPYLRGRGL